MTHMYHLDLDGNTPRPCFTP